MLSNFLKLCALAFEHFNQLLLHRPRPHNYKTVPRVHRGRHLSPQSTQIGLRTHAMADQNARTHACARTHTPHTKKQRESSRMAHTPHRQLAAPRPPPCDHGVLPPAAAGSGRSIHRDQRLGIDLIDREVDDVVVDDLRLAERHRRFEQLLALASQEDVGGDEHR